MASYSQESVRCHLQYYKFISYIHLESGIIGQFNIIEGKVKYY
jgi:hypothetical protein